MSLTASVRWQGAATFVVAALAACVILLGLNSYALAIFILLGAVVRYGAYWASRPSDPRGTARGSDHDARL
jgi:hypothetical protein